MIVIPDASERTDLDLFLDSVTPYYHLFTNDIVPRADTLLADFTEPTWPAYAPKKVTTWTPAVTIAGRAVSTADQQLWARGPIGPPGQVFGYYVTNGPTGPLMWCERRPAGPIRMQMPGDAVLILPRITLAECREGPVPTQGGGDLVADGSSTHSVPPLMGGGDLVGDGSSTHSTPAIPGGGDLVGDGSSTHSTPAIPGGGDLVGDGSSTSGPIARFGGGDLVGDGSSTSGP